MKWRNKSEHGVRVFWRLFDTCEPRSGSSNISKIPNIDNSKQNKTKQCKTNRGERGTWVVTVFRHINRAWAFKKQKTSFARVRGERSKHQCAQWSLHPKPFQTRQPLLTNLRNPNQALQQTNCGTRCWSHISAALCAKAKIWDDERSFRHKGMKIVKNQPQFWSRWELS